MAMSFCRKNGRDIILASEPNLRRVSASGWYTDDNRDVAIAVINKNVKIYDRGKGTGYVWVDVGDYNIYSCYISPNVSKERAEFTLLELMKDLVARSDGKPCVITGDFNAKSPEWGGDRHDDRGQMLGEWIATMNLVVHNDGKRPTLIRGQWFSYIDLTLSSASIADRLKGWKVEDEETLSDHQFITFRMECEKQENEIVDARTKGNGWRTKSLIATVLRQSFLEELGKNQRKSCLNMVEALKIACDKHLPKKGRGNVRRRNVYWWNNDIAAARKECIQAKRKLTRLNATNKVEEIGEAKNIHNQKKKIYRHLIRKAKEAKWNQLVDEIENDQWGLGYQIVTKKLRLNPEQIALSVDFKRKIVDALFPRHPIQKWRFTRNCEVEKFTIDEMRSAVRKLKTGKAPGPDNIPVEVVKAVATEEGEEIMLKIYNDLLCEGVFPKQWKQARLVLLKKPGKEGREPSDYRPLCLIDVLAKLYEQLILQKLKKELRNHGGLSTQQYGFQEGKSTIDAIERVLDLAQCANSGSTKAKKWCALVTFDVRNAFNSANWKNIMEALAEKGIPEYLRKVIGSYLSERSIDLGEGQVMQITSGVPQGSVLGPTLWNILYDGVLRLAIPREAVLVAYADDLALVVTEKYMENLVSTVEMTTIIISQWMRSKGLQLAPEKTEAVLLMGGRRPETEIFFMIDNVQLRPKSVIKYLGVDLDQRMSFGPHVMRTSAKAEAMTAMLARLMPNVRGPSPSKRKILAEVTNSIMMYAAPIWGPKATSIQKYADKLSSVQRKAALRICSAYRTISLDAAQVIAGIVPIDLRIIEAKRIRDRMCSKREARERSLSEWQTRWDVSTKGRWTHRLIPNIKRWLERRKQAGQVNYYLTQILSGHGDFRSYLYKMHRAEDDRCVYCSETDTAEHVFFECPRWNAPRRRLEMLVDEKITPDNLVEIMLRDHGNWRSVQSCAEEILKDKEKDEKEKQTAQNQL